MYIFDKKGKIEKSEKNCKRNNQFKKKNHWYFYSYTEYIRI